MKTQRLRACKGFTLIEVTMAMSLTALMCVGVIAVGMKGRRFTEHSRLASEARSLAKERIEEMMAVGRDQLALPTCMFLNGSTGTSTLGGPIYRYPRVLWHTGDRTLTNAAAAEYAEIHVDVVYQSPLLDRSVTDTFTTIVH